MKKSWDKQIDELATDFMQRLDGIYLGGPAESKSNETQPEGRDRREQEDSEAIGDSTGDDPSTGQPSTVGDECVPKQTPSNKNAKKTRTIVAEKRPTWDELVTEEEEKRSWLNEKNQKSLRGRSSICDRLRFSKFDYSLTEDKDYTLWRDKIKAEIKANDCLFVIDKRVKPRESFEEWEMNMIQNAVRSFIISHLNDKYHRLVKNIEDPAELMMVLDNFGDSTSRHAEYSLRKKFGDIRYEPSEETVIEFLARFDDLVDKIRRCAELTDDQVKFNFLVAIENGCSAVQMMDLNSREGLSITDLKAKMFEEENRMKELRRRENNGLDQAMFGATKKKLPTKFNSANPTRNFDTKDATCFKCGENGHISPDCSNRGRKCYNCQKFTTSHISATCPARRERSNNHETVKRGPSFASAMNKPRKVLKLRKVPFKAAVKAAKQRRRTGRANLVIYTDSDTESLPSDKRMCWVDDEVEDEVAMYANNREKDGDSDDQGHPKRAALSSFDSKYKIRRSMRFIADTGATDHIANEKEYFVSLRKLNRPKRITCANGSKNADLVIEHAGDIVISSDNDGSFSCLHDVLYAPGLVENLFSLRKLMPYLTAKFSDDKIEIEDKSSGEIVKEGEFDGRFWWLTFSLPLAGASEKQKQRVLSQVYQSRVGGRKPVKRGAAILDAYDLEIGGSSQSKQSKKSLEEKADDDLEDNSGVNEEDLKNLNVQRSESLRDCVGFLWHLRLNHASKGYLEQAAK
ncbi:unnamed protein product, partial [Nesidiocoris tenuis]